MKPRDYLELATLAALWGASFLFMRLGAGEFGALPLAEMRVVGAAALLLPLLAWQGHAAALRTHWRPIAVVGLLNSALPFALFSFAALSINAGLSAIFNAGTPLFGAAIAWLVWRERLLPWRVAGLVVGFAGVVGLAGGSASFKDGGTGWAVVACIVASALYGFSANYTRQTLQAVPPMAVAAGSQAAAALMLALPAWWAWPAQTPSATAWAATAVLALACTGLAYLLFFRLISRVGAANAISVTFLIPMFALAWGAMLLGEAVTLAMAAGCAVIVAGTALATGLVAPGGRRTP